MRKVISFVYPQDITPMKIAVFAAFPQELKQMRRSAIAAGSGRDARFPVHFTAHRGSPIILVETGMSPDMVEDAFNTTVDDYRPDVVVSAGFGGALYYRADIGEVVFASRYFFFTREGIVELPQLSLRNGRFRRHGNNGGVASALQRKTPVKEGSFITIPRWMEKKGLRPLVPEHAPFPVCERETIHLAKLSYKRNIPFFALRSITDTLDYDIPEAIFEVADTNGRYRLSCAVGLMLSRPALIPDFLKLGRNAAVASKNLAEAVRSLADVLSDPEPAPQPPRQGGSRSWRTGTATNR